MERGQSRAELRTRFFLSIFVSRPLYERKLYYTGMLYIIHVKPLEEASDKAKDSINFSPQTSPGDDPLRGGVQ